MFKEEIIKLIAKELKKKEGAIELTIPPNQALGDYAFPCFALAKEKRKSPIEIAKELANEFSSKIKNNKLISQVKPEGPYVNFYINTNELANEIIPQILKEKKEYGKTKQNQKKIVIEYPAPNTNKPLHLGHVRNMLIGSSVSNLLETVGNKVIPVNLNNDRGVHICKSMLAYQKFGNNEKPNIKSDHFVGKYYVMFCEKAKENPKLEEEAQEMLRKWESGDKEIIALWKKMNTW